MPKEPDAPGGNTAGGPAYQASTYVPAALRNLGMQPYPQGLVMGSDPVAAQMQRLQRGKEAYRQMTRDAQVLGIPASAVPAMLPDDEISEEKLAELRTHLELMISSFLSASL